MRARKKGEVSLERALSKLGLASRSQARALVLAGKVKVNGQVILHPGQPVVPETVRVTIDGAEKKKADWTTLLIHKPTGILVTRSDEKNRETIYSLLPDHLPYLHPVGRLDAASSGLLLLTNDTRLSDWLTDPKNHVARTYEVTVRGEMTGKQMKQLEHGVHDQGEFLKASKATLVKAGGRESHLRVELQEGKNREVRRLLESLGHEVSELKRVAFGPFELGSLKPGEVEYFTREEVRKALPHV